MYRILTLVAVVLTGSLALPTAAHAWFFIFPIPNLAKPAPLNALIEALEKSEETKAVAYVSEDKTFGAKYWVWGHFSGHVTQAEADRIALSRCQSSLAAAKSQQAGGNALYDFGSKVCELYEFANKAASPRATEQQRAAPATPTQPPAASTAPPEPAPQQQNKTVSPTTPAPEHLVTTPTPIVPSALAPGASAQTQPASVPQSTGSATARRLRELDELRKEGLITESEYIEKRKAILSAM